MRIEIFAPFEQIAQKLVDWCLTRMPKGTSCSILPQQRSHSDTVLGGVCVDSTDVNSQLARTSAERHGVLPWHVHCARAMHCTWRGVLSQGCRLPRCTSCFKPQRHGRETCCLRVKCVHTHNTHTHNTHTYTHTHNTGGMKWPDLKSVHTSIQPLRSCLDAGTWRLDVHLAISGET